MLYREIIAVCSQIHTKHINTLCGQNVELLNVKLAVHIVTTGLSGVWERCSVYLNLYVYRYVQKQTMLQYAVSPSTYTSPLKIQQHNHPTHLRRFNKTFNSILLQKFCDC